MAQVEFTQQFNTSLTSGVTKYFTSPMQSVAGVYVVKGLSFYTTGGFTALSLLNAADNIGTSAQTFFSTPATVAANTVAISFNPDQQIILTQPYLGFNCTGAGLMTVSISYSFIPSSNTLAANFGNRFFAVSGPGNLGSFAGLSATIPTIIKSITIVNGSSALDLSVFLTSSAGAFAFYSDSLIANDTSIITLPLYLVSTDTVSIETPSTANFTIIYSYTQQLN